MRTILTMTAATLFLLASTPRPAPAQEEEEGETPKKGAPGLPSRYIDCIQPLTLDILLSAQPNQWGFSGELAKTAPDRFYGIQLCRSYVEETRHYCRQLASVPARGKEKQMFEKMGYDCALDSSILLTHSALLSEGRTPFEPRCVDWCGLEQASSAKKIDCAAFCAEAKPLMPGRATDVCKAYVERTASFNASDSEYAHEASIACRMRLDPSPASCTDQLGPMAQKWCREHQAVREAMRLKNPKLCPKSIRFAAVCAAMTAPEGKPKGEPCLAATRAFTVPFCNELKESGGLQDTMKLPGDPDSKAEW